MGTLKSFIKWLIIVIVFYFFSNLIIFIGLNATYKNVKNYEILNEVPKIEITESKATAINGYVGGKLTNNSGELIDKTYIKLDFYSARDVNLGTKYVEVQNLKPDDSRDFRIGFKFKDVAKYTVSIVEEPIDATEDQFISEEMKFNMLLAGIFLLYFI